MPHVSLREILTQARENGYGVLSLLGGNLDLVGDCHARGKLCAAICHGQLVLISAGLMRGVRATAAWSMMDDLRVAGEIDGLLLPGGLATWMIRGHLGLRKLIQDVNAAGKPIGAVERGLKLALTTGALDGRAVTCAPQMRDDVIQAVARIEYRDVPVVQDGNLLTCQGTEDLSEFVRALVAAYGKR